MTVENDQFRANLIFPKSFSFIWIFDVFFAVLSSNHMSIFLLVGILHYVDIAF